MPTQQDHVLNDIYTTYHSLYDDSLANKPLLEQKIVYHYDWHLILYFLKTLDRDIVQYWPLESILEKHDIAQLVRAVNKLWDNCLLTQVTYHQILLHEAPFELSKNIVQATLESTIKRTPKHNIPNIEWFNQHTYPYRLFVVVHQLPEPLNRPDVHQFLFQQSNPYHGLYFLNNMLQCGYLTPDMRRDVREKMNTAQLVGLQNLESAQMLNYDNVVKFIFQNSFPVEKTALLATAKMMLQDTVPQQLFSLILNHDNPKQVLDAMRECKKFDDFTLNDLTTLLTNNATCQNILYLSKHNALDQYHYGMLVKEQDIQANAAFIYTIGIINRRSYTSSEFIRQTLELTTSCLQKLKHLTQVDDKLIHYIHSVKAPLSYIDSLVKLNNRCGLAIDAGIKRDMALISDPSKMLKVYEYLINSSAASEFECAVLYSCACHYNHIWGDDEVFSRFERIQNGIDKIQFEHLIQLTKRYANDPETAKSVISQELDDILFLREHLLYDEDSYLFSTSYNFFSNLGNQEIDEHFDVSQFLKFDN